MNHPRERYEANVARLRQVSGGTVAESSNKGDDLTPPYRVGKLEVVGPAAFVAARGAELAALAVEVGGYLTLSVYERSGTWILIVSRDLNAEEIRAICGDVQTSAQVAA